MSTTGKQRRKLFDKLDDLQQYASATLGSSNLRDTVKLPNGENLNEWLAVNILDFFNQISMLYGTITDHCTPISCPKMCAGLLYEYSWSDGGKAISCSAPVYIDYLFAGVRSQLDDENVFPSQIGVPFPQNFIQVAKTIMKRLFRVYAHIYHQHLDLIEQLKELEHLNTSFKHFMLFVHEFDLIEQEQLAPLKEFIEVLAPNRESRSNFQ
uniref:MOB kinase activator-like 1 n=1 Tax=Syphacia muris TaxID=451379 RepID=A0A0N5AW01_9BILA